MCIRDRTTFAANLELLIVSTILAVIVCPLLHRNVVAENVAEPGQRDDGQPVVYRLDPITNVRVLPDCFPEVPGKAGGLLSLSACRGEYESASFAVYAPRELENVRLEISDFRFGKHVLPKSHLELFVVKCWYQAGRDVMFHDGVKRLVPELLLKDDALVKVDTKKQTNAVRSTKEDGSTKYLPASGKDPKALEGLRPIDASKLQPVTIPGKSVKQFWLRLHVPADAAAGTYRGSIRLSAQGITPVDIPVAVTVHAFELARSQKTYSIYYSGKLDPNSSKGTIAAHYKSEEQYLAETRDMLAHGVRYPNLWQTRQSGLVPRSLQLRKKAGLPNDKLFILSPPGPPAGAAIMVKLWRKFTDGFGSVSYPHLTLPTSDLV